jgi:hypothetical protein
MFCKRHDAIDHLSSADSFEKLDDDGSAFSITERLGVGEKSAHYFFVSGMGFVCKTLQTQ